jgi:hypothetical protein
VGRCTKCGAPAYNVSQISTSTSGGVENAGNSNPDNDFRFDATLGSTGGYIFNLCLANCYFAGYRACNTCCMNEGGAIDGCKFPR